MPVTVLSPVRTLGGKLPVMPVREKRGEKFVMVPPAVATEIIFRKLGWVEGLVSFWEG